MNGCRLLLPLLLFGSLTACESSPTVATLPEFIRGKDFEGFGTFPTPRTFDAPGTVFRVGNDGRRFTVEDLSPKLRVSLGAEVFPSSKYERNFELSAFAELVGLPLTAEIRASMGRGLSTEIELGFASRETTLDADVKRAILDASEGWDFEEGFTYYIIRETISVESIRYVVRADSEALADLDLTNIDPVDTDWRAEWSNESEIVLDQEFQRPHRIFYKVEQIRPLTGFSGVLRFELDEVPPDQLNYREGNPVSK